MNFDKIAAMMSNNVDRVVGAAGRELGRVGAESRKNVSNDFTSIADAIDKHGFLGGAVQAADVFSPGHQVANGLDAWNVIPEDPALKELISGGVNLASGAPFSLLALKDLADAVGAMRKPTGPVPAPSAPHAAQAPRPGSSGNHGYPGCEHRSANVCATQEMSMRELGDLLAALKGCREGRAAYCEAHPDAPVPGDGTYTIDEILNHPTMSTGEVCCRIVAVIVHEHPDAVARCGEAAGVEPPATDVPAPGAPAAGQSATPYGDAIFGMFGQVASFLGPILGNPMVATLLAGLLAATPLAPIAMFLPVILPIAGTALSALGGMSTQVSQGQDPTLSLGGGASPDMLGGLLQAVTGMLGGAPSAGAAVPGF